MFALMELGKNVKTHLGQYSDSKGNKSEVEMTEIQWRFWRKLPLFFAGLFCERNYSSTHSFENLAEEKMEVDVPRAGPPPPRSMTRTGKESEVVSIYPSKVIWPIRQCAR